MQQDLFEINHFELCKMTAERCAKTADVVVYEYNWVSSEKPDVLSYNGGYTELYEIKVSISDFKDDSKKSCRRKYKIRYWPTCKTIKRNIEAPHLGLRRYYVCPAGMIQPEEVERWGLYWIKNGRFYKKKESEIFVRNIFLELNLLSHAMRKLSAGVDKNIFVKPYYTGE